MIDKCQVNLFLIGAMKAGTTTLQGYLTRHPEIYMSPIKEPYFFSSKFDRGVKWYNSLFEESRDVLYRGEASTEYTKLPLFPEVVDRISTHTKNARFIYLLRDPVKRSISQYWWESHHSFEWQDMLQAIQNSPLYLDYSYYAMQLRPYIDRFGMNNIYVLTLENLIADTVQELEKLRVWLNLTQPFEVSNKLEHRNPGPSDINQVKCGWLFGLIRGTPLWNWAKAVIPTGVTRSVRASLKRPVTKDNSQVEKTIEFLRPIQITQTEELKKILGRDFPEWHTLYNTKQNL